MMDARKSTWLSQYRHDVYSQLGEDGVIGKILEILPGANKWCVEFGAYDGMFLSNVRNLTEHQAYSAVLIEASGKRFKDLQANYKGFDNIHLVNRFVGYAPDDNLDTILSATPIPVDFDFLSIDIDGNDYHVWKAVQKYRPKYVCIEFNHTIPTDLEFVQEADPRTHAGSSLLSITNLGREKGYELVSVSPCNAHFVKTDYFPLFSISDNSPHSLRTDVQNVTHIFSGFDGHVYLRGHKKLAIHMVDLKESRVQVLPGFLQKTRDSYALHELIAYLLLLFLRKPGYFMGKFKGRFLGRRIG